jgi:hypothetical protein
MAYNSKYVSRTGKLSCTSSGLFAFITDIRNLGQFIPEGSIRNWHANSDSCSFSVPPLSNVKVWISEKKPYSLVCFSADALKKDDFKLEVQIRENTDKLAEVKLILTADLNPMITMMVSGPIEKFLEILISEMERFEKWNETIKGRPPL